MDAITTTERVPTGALRTGDVVYDHGMRLLIDQPIRAWDDNATGTTVHNTSALVTNIDKVRADGIVPIGWLYEDGDGPRWTIQGNELARWNREVQPQNAPCL